MPLPRQAARAAAGTPQPPLLSDDVLHALLFTSGEIVASRAPCTLKVFLIAIGIDATVTYDGPL